MVTSAEELAQAGDASDDELEKPGLIYDSSDEYSSDDETSAVRARANSAVKELEARRRALFQAALAVGPSSAAEHARCARDRAIDAKYRALLEGSEAAPLEVMLGESEPEADDSGSEREFLVDSGANVCLIKRPVPGATVVSNKPCKVRGAFEGASSTARTTERCEAALAAGER